MPPVYSHAQRTVSWPKPRIQRWIVEQYGIGAYHNGVALRSQPVYQDRREPTGQSRRSPTLFPLAVDVPIAALGPLEGNPWPLLLVEGHEPPVET